MSWTRVLLTGMLCVAGAGAQDKAQEKKDAPVFRTETRLVPVDVVVMDKKGNYVHDLEAKDFKVWEDGKEQQIKNFSFEADPASPLATQQKYIVLFFDNSSMNLGDQVQARQAAVKFIDANAGPNRLMAVANFGGSLQISQNFTDDIERLKQVVNGVKVASLSTAGPARTGRGGIPRLGAEAQLGARSVMLALRNLAKGLEDVPGRKTLVMLSAGFPLAPEMISEVQAAIAACNRANIAIYPIDVRGLTSLPFAPMRGAVTGPQRNLAYAGIAMAGSPVIRIASFLAAPQRGGAAGGGATGGAAGGGAPSGGAGGGAAGGAGAGGGGAAGGGARGGGGGIGGASMGSPSGNNGGNGGNGGGGVFRGGNPA